MSKSADDQPPLFALRRDAEWNIMRPSSVDDLVLCLKQCSDKGLRIKVASSGHNWGYTSTRTNPIGGDAFEPCDEVLLDLSNLAFIRHFDDEIGTVEIGAGTTQGQLSSFLEAQGNKWYVDTTSAGSETSIVGNMSDRGFGNSPLGNRAANLLSATFVLADGTVETTDSRGLIGEGAVATPFCPGPSMTSLLIQGNFAVTAAVKIALNRRSPHELAVGFELPKRDLLGQFVEAIRDLKLMGRVPGCIHVANDLRLLSNLFRPARKEVGDLRPLDLNTRIELDKKFGVKAWTGFTVLAGSKETLRADLKMIKRGVKGFARIRAFSPRAVERVSSVLSSLSQKLPILNRWKFFSNLKNKVSRAKVLVGTLLGRPSNELLFNTGWRILNGHGLEISPDLLDRETTIGIRWFAPSVPLKKDAVDKLMTFAEPIFAKYGFDMLVMFTCITDRFGVAVFNILFDQRVDTERQRADECWRELWEEGVKRGLVPYRVPDFAWTEPLLVRGGSLRKIKDALDPKKVISPGRYGL